MSDHHCNSTPAKPNHKLTLCKCVEKNPRLVTQDKLVTSIKEVGLPAVGKKQDLLHALHEYWHVPTTHDLDSELNEILTKTDAHWNLARTEEQPTTTSNADFGMEAEHHQSHDNDHSPDLLSTEGQGEANMDVEAKEKDKLQEVPNLLDLEEMRIGSEPAKLKPRGKATTDDEEEEEAKVDTQSSNVELMHIGLGDAD